MPPNKNKNGRVVPSSDDEAQPPVQPRAQPRAPPARQPLQPSTVHNQTGKVKKSAEIARLVCIAQVFYQLVLTEGLLL
jgi:hypothetical protein